MNADEKKKQETHELKNADENDHKTVCRHSKNGLGSCGKLLYKGPQKDRKVPDVGVTAAEKFSRESCKEMTTCSCYSLQLRKNRRGGGC